MAQADVLRALAGCGEEDLRGRGVRVLLEEVVLDLEHVVEAELVRQFHLVEGVFQELVLLIRVPLLLVARPGQLVLVEETEFHGRTLAFLKGRLSVCVRVRAHYRTGAAARQRDKRILPARLRVKLVRDA